MRLLMLSQSYAPTVGGEERVVEDLSHELAGRGHEVAVATLALPRRQRSTVENGIPVHRLRSTSHRIVGLHRDSERRHAPPAPDPETVLDLRRLVARLRPDVVHAHNWLVHSYLPLDRRTDAALVLSLHDYSLLCATKRLLRKSEVCSGPGPVKCVLCAGEHYGRLRGIVAAAGTLARQPLVRRHVDLFLPVSSTVRDRSAVSEAEGEVIPNFLGGLPEAPRDDDPRLAQLPEEPFILYFGDVTEDKGAWELVETYRGLEDPPPLVLIGRCYLDEVAGRPGVHVLGAWPHDLAIEALRRSLFSVAPSIWPEPFGLVALEAAAAGKPVVASDIGGLTDIVADGETGILVEPRDREALGRALSRLIDDAELRERMGAAAVRRAADFRPESVVPRFEAAYERARRLRRARRSAGR
jgi:glycosyltransferase involved in cell wall biosynthesis